jgi:hypothetical protein
MSINSNPWDALKNERCPRIWLIREDKHILIQWESITHITASADFLTLTFDCEYGLVSINSTESLQELFEELQLEQIRMIDGRKLKVKIQFSGK